MNHDPATIAAALRTFIIRINAPEEIVNITLRCGVALGSITKCIADTDVDPVAKMVEYKKRLRLLPWLELLGASVRKVLNIFQAEEVGCEIVTVPHDILLKAAKTVGIGLKDMSLDTVKMFVSDARAAGLNLRNENSHHIFISIKLRLN